MRKSLGVIIGSIFLAGAIAATAEPASAQAPAQRFLVVVDQSPTAVASAAQ